MKSPAHLVALALLVLGGCQSAGQERTEHKMSYGPPPPGYVRIRGEAVPNWKPQHMNAAPGARAALTWAPMGPRPITNEVWSGNDDASGRVVSIAPHPSDPDIVYIASASGGIWKTTDGGDLWVPLTDELSSLNHGCVALDPSNPDTVYAGTGEYQTSTTGDGLFRSLDAGATWERIATTGQVGSLCSQIVVDPTNSDIIHLTGGKGYVRSLDGGATWQNTLSGSASDLAVNPNDPSVLYVGRHGDGVYKSVDGGSTWVRLGGGLPSSDVSRVLVDVAASNPNVVYTAIVNNSAGLRGFYRSADAGTTWLQRPNTPDFPSPQGWYDVFLGVSPTNEDLVYAGGVFPSYAPAGVIRSFNGGTSWFDVTVGATGGQLHPDQHAIAFGPTGSIWVGNDGGIWRSDNNGSRWISRNTTLTVTQNYNIALHPTDTTRMMGGTQDNGTVGRDLGLDQWPQVFGGDGGFLAYDFDNPSIRYTTYVRLAVYRFLGGAFNGEITGPWGSDPVQFIAPLVMDPNTPKTLLGGTNRVWRTQNADTGANWMAISTSTVAAGGTLTAIAVATGASNTIYTGSTTGRVYVTTDASTWNNRSTGLPTGQVSDIVIDPADPATAYVTFHRTSGTRVLRTEDYGVSWGSVTGNMPTGISARALAVDWRASPPGLYVGSGVGVYFSQDGGATWVKDGTDLPNVNIGDLVIDFDDETITAGTYGRGAWRAALPVISATAAQPAPGVDGVRKNRYVSFDPANENREVAFQVELLDGPGAPAILGWVGVPGADTGGTEAANVARLVDAPVFRVWPEAVVHVSDCGIVPVASYGIRTTADAVAFTSPLEVATIAEPTPKLWGDCVGELVGTTWQGPDGTANIQDAFAAIKKFQGTGFIPPLSYVDVHPEIPNNVVNFDDVLLIILAFKGEPYPYSDPLPCP